MTSASFFDAEAAAERAAIQAEANGRAAPDFAAARNFLQRLDPEAERFTFQTFDDTPAKRPLLARVVTGDPSNGALDQLARLNARGAGVFVTVNASDGQGRQAHNIVRVRAVFVDLDGSPLAPILAAGLEPHVIVESSLGRFHAYWLTDDCPLDQFERVQRALARRFNADPSVHDLPRVLRLPGFVHQKVEPFATRVLDGIGTTVPPYALAEIVASLRLELDAPDSKAHARANGDGGKIAAGNDRHGHLFALARSMARRSTPNAVRAALAAENLARCDPPVSDADLDYLAARAFDAKHARGWQDAPPRDATGADGATHQPDAESATAGDSWPKPINILAPLAAPPLTRDDVPRIIGHYADLFSRAAGFDGTAALVAGVATVAAATDDRIRLLLPGTSGHFESARLWFAAIAPPGTGKSPAERTMLAPVHALHRDLIEQSNRTREAAGKDDPAPPRLALFTSDVTIDKLSEILADNPRGILYAVDELDSWLGSHDAFTRDGGSRNRGEWMRLYDGGPHQVDRVTRGSFYVPNWGASILTATTPAAIARLARKLSADGLFQRFLVFTLQRMRERDDTLAHHLVEIARSEYAERVAVIFGHVAATVDPPIVRLAPGAAALYDAEHRRLLTLTEAAEHVGDGFAAHVAKHPAMLARVALTFHAAGDDLSLPDGHCRHPCAVPLSEATMAQAARFMRRAYQHAHAIYSTLFADGAPIALAQAVARAILADASESFNRRELTHRCRAFRGVPEWQRVAVFRALEDFAWIEGETFLPEHGGRWRVNPKVHTLFAAEAARWRERREQVRDALHGQDEA